MSPMTQPIRILVAAEQPKIRDKLVAQLSTQPDFSVVAEAASGQEAVDLSALYQPDVVLLDLDLPGLEGVEIVRRIASAYVDARVVVMTAFDTDERIADATRAGARGHVARKCSQEALIDAARAAYRSGPPQPPVIASRLLRHLKPDAAPGTTAPPTGPAFRVTTGHLRAPLTAREREVLQFFARGRSAKEIAAVMNVNERAIHSELATICDKLGAENFAHAIQIAKERGLVKG